MNITVKIALGLVATAATAFTAYAAVTVDENGIGFVGKGDVQLAFEWNNATLQANGNDLTFQFSSSEAVTWTCKKDGDSATQTQTRKRTQTVRGSVAYDARKNKQGQITGFNLDGWDGEADETTSGPGLHSCPTGWTHQVDLDETTVLDEGGLSVTHNGDTKHLLMN